MFKIERLPSAESLFQFVKDEFFTCARKAIKNNGRFNVAVSGGSTPVKLFELLATSNEQKGFWEQVCFFWVDERWVREEDSENNYGSAMRAGLKDIPARYIYFDTSLPSPWDARKDYEEKLRQTFKEFPVFDLILLGAGTDGHTASVFSDDLPEAKKEKTVMVTKHPKSLQLRLTLTLSVITRANQVMLVLQGKEKKPVLDKLLQNQEADYPIEFAIFEAKSAIVATDI